MISVLDEVQSPAAWQVINERGLLNFKIPSQLEAGEPPEARGLGRDQVRLMVSRYQDGTILHTCFRSLPHFLTAGDVLVINTSATLKAALSAVRADGTPLEVHLSTHLPGDLWNVEVRQSGEKGSEPLLYARQGERIALSGGGNLTLLAPYDPKLRGSRLGIGTPVRLWVASLELDLSVEDYLERNGFPIRYKYVKENWPIEYYQTVYAQEPGSAEMPSAGRAFTPELITHLVASSIQVAPLVLHTGVASLEAHEHPYEEYYRVPPQTAELVNLAHANRRRVVAVGTTVVRALETVASPRGQVAPGEGWTDLVITPERGLRAVDGLLTGFHEAHASHLDLLAALCGLPHLQKAYQQALTHDYLWHEFGDLHLILP